MVGIGWIIRQVFGLWHFYNLLVIWVSKFWLRVYSCGIGVGWIIRQVFGFSHFYNLLVISVSKFWLRVYSCGSIGVGWIIQQVSGLWHFYNLLVIWVSKFWLRVYSCIGEMFYGAVVFDPWLIVAQIIALQCLYYLTLGLFLSVLVGTRVSRMSLVYFFDYATITASTVTGWCVIVSILLTSTAGAAYMLYLIERAKKCLDFSATLYIIHLFICITYGGWPSSITWWIVNGSGFAVMALLGEYLCIRRELREIPIRYRAPV